MASRKVAETTREQSLDNWVSYRFGLVAARIGAFAAPMYLERHGLNMPGWRCLSVIANYGKLSAKELAARTSSDSFKIARAIEMLTQRGLIVRDTDPVDRRKASLSLTDKGQQVYDDIAPFADSIQRQVVSTLTLAELRYLDVVLTKIDVEVEKLHDTHWRAFLKTDCE